MKRWKVSTAIGLTILVTGTFVVGSFKPVRAAMDAFLACSSSSACLEWDNSGIGPGVKGVSTSGNGLSGQTKFKSAGKTSGTAGVIGTDLSTSGNLDAGVSGVSKNGTGVIGTSTTYNGMQGLTSGAGASGAYGQNSASTGFGVAGRNTSTTKGNGAGVYADGGTSNNAMVAFSNSTDAIYAFSDAATSFTANQGPTDNNPELNLQAGGSSSVHEMFRVRSTSAVDVFNVDSAGTVRSAGDISSAGISSGSISSSGVQVVGSTGTAGYFGNNPGNYERAALQAVGGGVGTDDDVFVVTDANGYGQMYVTDTGNVQISGEISTSGSCSSGCIAGGKRVRSVREYTPKESEPTIEDNGEAQLVGGRADVALDPKFVNVIDLTARYLVYVTPDGDCRGLYVAQRTARGFTVRELQGGNSSLTFDYRIVAKEIGVNAPRLPMTAVRPAIALPRRPMRLRP